MFACCECCVLSGRGLCDELITRPEESYRLWCVVVCDQETSKMRRPWPALGPQRQRKQNLNFVIPVVTCSEVRDCRSSLADIVGSNPVGGHGCLSLASIACWKVEVRVTDWCLVQRRLNECGASEYDLETTTLRTPRLIRLSNHEKIV